MVGLCTLGSKRNTKLILVELILEPKYYDRISVMAIIVFLLSSHEYPFQCQQYCPPTCHIFLSCIQIKSLGHPFKFEQELINSLPRKDLQNTRLVNFLPSDWNDNVTMSMMLNPGLHPRVGGILTHCDLYWKEDMSHFQGLIMAT